MKAKFPLILFLVFVVVFYTSCTDNEDFGNPLDPENLRTAGAPIGLELAPGDQRVIVSWQNLELDGIVTYRIYRRFTGDSDTQFERVGEVDAPTTEFLDTQSIKNDQFDLERDRPLFYEYRISYIDSNGVETPDPSSPPSEDADPLKVWPVARTTPSDPPPAPNVVLGDPTDLVVKLFWQDYEAPDDFEIFLVRAAVVDEGGNPGVFRLGGETTEDRPFFFDEEFSQDGITKVYHVVAVDRFGVETITEVRATSPDLPPAPPQDFRAFFNVHAGGRYDVFFFWSRNKEADLAGYQLYATSADGELLSRPAVDPKQSAFTFAGDQAILVGQNLVFRQYFISAFDDTPKPDGSPDESELVAAQR